MTWENILKVNVRECLPMFSAIGVWWCVVLYLSLSANLSLFSCVVWWCALVSLICMQLSRFPSNACRKVCLFPILCSCLLCQRLIDHRCLGLFLYSLLCSIGLSVSIGTSTTLSWWPGLCNIAWNLGELCFLLGFVLQIALVIVGLLWFRINFWIVCPSSLKNVICNSIGIALNL